MKARPSPLVSAISGSLGSLTFRSARSKILISARRNKPHQISSYQYDATRVRGLFNNFWASAPSAVHAAWSLYASLTNASSSKAAASNAAGKSLAYKTWFTYVLCFGFPQSMTYFYPFLDSSSTTPLLAPSASFADAANEYNVTWVHPIQNYIRTAVFASRMFTGSEPRSARRWKFITYTRGIDGYTHNLWNSFRDPPISYDLAVGETVALRLRPIQYAIISSGHSCYRIGPETLLKVTVEP